METPSSPTLTLPMLTLTSASSTTSSFACPSESRSPPNLFLNTALEMSSPMFTIIMNGATSTDSTPVQMSTEEDEDDGKERWIVDGEEEESLKWSLDMENGPER